MKRFLAVIAFMSLTISAFCSDSLSVFYRIRLDGDIADSRIDFKTITYFAPQLEGNRLKAGISGRFAGYVDNFDIIGLKIASDAGGFTGTINGSMKGLPEKMTLIF